MIQVTKNVHISISKINLISKKLINIPAKIGESKNFELYAICIIALALEKSSSLTMSVIVERYAGSEKAENNELIVTPIKIGRIDEELRLKNINTTPSPDSKSAAIIIARLSYLSASMPATGDNKILGRYASRVINDV